MNGHEVLRGVAIVAAVHVSTFLAHLAIPVKETTGYACDCTSGRPLRYRCNGFRVLVCAITMASVAWYLGADVGLLSATLWPCFSVSFVLGIVVSLIFFVVGKRRLQRGSVDEGASCLTTNGSRSEAAKSTKDFRSRSALEHYYVGPTNIHDLSRLNIAGLHSSSSNATPQCERNVQCSAGLSGIRARCAVSI